MQEDGEMLTSIDIQRDDFSYNFSVGQINREPPVLGGTGGPTGKTATPRQQQQLWIDGGLGSDCLFYNN